MALINCPECGKENVSDTAKSCPSCGFNIKQYVEGQKEKQKRQEELEKQKIEKRKQNQKRIIELKKELDKKLHEIDNELIPIKPPLYQNLFDKDTVVCWITGIIIGIFSFYFGFEKNSELFQFLFVVLILFGIPILLFLSYTNYDTAKNRYNTQLERYNNKEKRKQELIDEFNNQKKKESYNETYQYNQSSRQNTNSYVAPINSQKSNKLKCPVCGSTNVQKISTASRIVSVGMVGIASSKIGKQYECKNCHHKW